MASNMLGMFWYGSYGFGLAWASYAFPGKSMEEIGKDGMMMPLSLSMFGQGCVTTMLVYMLE